MQNSKTNFLYIQRPKIQGSVVYFSWNMDFDPQKSTNEIYVDYYDIDISTVPMQVHYNTIIGLLLNHLIDLPIPTIVITEDAVSDDIASFWVNYHDLQNVSFANINSVGFEKLESQQCGSAGILYGGGKDSYYALDSLSKNSKISQISLISFVIPDSHVNTRELEERRDKLILDAVAQNYTLDIIKIKTNARAIIKGYHLELYFAPLGVLVWLNLFNYITFSYEFGMYYVPGFEQDNFGFRRSHIGHIQKVSQFYSENFSTQPVVFFNANQHMTELSSFGYLVGTNPDFYKTLVMCESTTNPNEKWCCSCTKCAEFVLFSMYYNLNQSDIDIEWFFGQSNWISKVIKGIHSAPKKGLYIKGMSSIFHFDSFKFVLNTLKQRNTAFSSPQAQQNFNILTDYYSGQTTSDEDGFYKDILVRVYPDELIQDTRRVLLDHLKEIKSPNEKTSGIGRLAFNPEIQPFFNNRNAKIPPDSVYRNLAQQNAFTAFNGDPILGYAEKYQLSLKGIDYEQLVVKSTSDYIDLYITKNPIIQGDGYELEIKLKDLTQYGYLHGSLKLAIPRCSKDLSERFDLSVQVNDRSKSIDLSVRQIHLQFPLDKNIAPIIKVKVVATKNQEAWNWGELVS